MRIHYSIVKKENKKSIYESPTPFESDLFRGFEVLPKISIPKEYLSNYKIFFAGLKSS
jgi:hypothetical protein